jgi:hypothetical protein
LRRVLAQIDTRRERGAGTELVARLSAAFRAYLGARISLSCFALSPREFRSLEPLLPQEGQAAALEAIFRRCDELRFGPQAPGRLDLAALKDGVERCALALESAAPAAPAAQDAVIPEAAP